MAEHRSGIDLIGEWRKVMDSLVSSAASVTGHVPDVARLVVEQGERQLELVQQIVERERRMQREVADRMLAPLEAVLDLLGESASMLTAQAETLSSAGRALEETAGLMKGQAEAFARAVQTLREPVNLVKATAGPEAEPRPS